MDSRQGPPAGAQGSSKLPPLEAVADTNVVAYMVLRTPLFVEEVEPFWSSVSRALAPAHWRAEFANVVWGACRAGLLAVADARTLLNRAATFAITSIAVPELWHGALSRSLDTGIAIYDTLFVELAVQQGCPLATFDKAVLRAFPEIAARPRDLL
ncbi:MAG: type II toxin-antitoxin system VapC family toxin [Terriglobales bacterium]